MADNAADALSDLDLLAIVHENDFEEAWTQRAQLRVTGALCSWDQRPNTSVDVGAHRWLTPDLVLVEVLVATASSGVRLGEPWVLLVGDQDTPGSLVPRPPVDRSEMGAGDAHPVEQAYDDFKQRVRRACS